MTAPSENQMLDLVRVAIAEIESGGKVRIKHISLMYYVFIDFMYDIIFR